MYPKIHSALISASVGNFTIKNITPVLKNTDNFYLEYKYCSIIVIRQREKILITHSSFLPDKIITEVSHSLLLPYIPVYKPITTINNNVI